MLHKDTVNEYLTHLTLPFSSIRTGVKNHYQTTILIIIKLGGVQSQCFQFNLITVTNRQKHEDFQEDIQNKKFRLFLFMKVILLIRPIQNFIKFF